MKIEDKPAEWCAELKFKTEDETEFLIKPKLEHRRKLMFLQKKFDDNSYTEEDIKQQDEVIKGILKTSYPSFSDTKIESTLLNYGTEILLELYIAFKWRNREAIEALKKKQQMEIQELLEKKPEKKSSEDWTK